MRASRLAVEVQLFKPVQTHSAYGENKTDFVLIDSVWAGIEEAKGDIQYDPRAGNTTLQYQHDLQRMVIIYFRDDIRVGWRIQRDYETFEVVAIDPAEYSRAELKLRCKWVIER